MAARRRTANVGQTDTLFYRQHALFKSLHLSTWLSLETLTLPSAGNLGIPAFREPQKHSLALTQTLPPPPADLSQKQAPRRMFCPFLSSSLSPFTMELEQSGSTVPLHSCGSESQRGCCYFCY